MMWLILAVFASTALFVLKYQVQALEERLAGLHRHILVEQEAVHVLNAEWAYINRPKRLEDLSARLLGLAPMDVNQFTTISELPIARLKDLDEPGNLAFNSEPRRLGTNQTGHTSAIPGTAP